MSERFDVIVVGGRCAGSPVAAALAARGLSVCVLDRAQLTSDVPSTHVLQPAGVAWLDRCGLLDQVLETGAPPVVSGKFMIDDVSLEYDRDVSSRLEAPVICIRRSSLDPILAGAAATAGADVRLGTAVTGLECHDGKVVGVRTDAGTIQSKLVVGADGGNSTVAQLVGAKEYHVTPPGRIPIWAYFEGASTDGGVRLGKVRDLGFLGIPTDGGLYLAVVAYNFELKQQVLADRQQSYEAGLRAVEPLAETLSSARRVGRIRTMSRWYGYFRQAAGPGWALLGDAGHAKDPTPAQGMSDAFRQAERLAAAIDRGLGGGNLDAELRDWWRWRDDDAWESYWFATDLGAPGETPAVARGMLRSLAGRDGGAELFLRLLNHEIDPRRVLGPRQAAIAVASIARARPTSLPQLTQETLTLIRTRMKRRRLRHERHYT